MHAVRKNYMVIIQYNFKFVVWNNIKPPIHQ
jgi:phenylpropionate dioxygenase-like ring-hydroxylating dioxygenase large terminal subunit